MLIPIFLVAIVLVYIFSKYQKYLVVAPILGMLCGTIVWYLTLLFTEDLLREDAFFAFVSIGVIISECIFHHIDLDFD